MADITKQGLKFKIGDTHSPFCGNANKPYFRK